MQEREPSEFAIAQFPQDYETITRRKDEQVADVPEFIQPRTIVDMTDEEYEAILNPIRDRRMVLVALHTQAVTLKNKVKSEKLITKIDKLLARVEKEVAKQDKTIEQIQLFHAQIRGLKIEAMELEDVE